MQPNRVDELVAAWKDARDAGRPATLAEVCRDNPELVAAVAERITADVGPHTFTAPPGPPVVGPAEPLPASLGGYRVVALLGKGGMGSVYLAHDDRLGRAVAVKTLQPAEAARPEAKERFLREARSVAQIEHDNVIPLWQVGEDSGVPFIAMPLLHGETLDARLRREKVPPVGVLLKVGREVADALAAAHARNLVHRDVKPANIWLEGDPTSADPGGRFRRTKVLDFGLARAPGGDTHLTAPGGLVGTPAFMSPEQAAGDPVDHRTDLFSLGVVLYRMATGEQPFTGSSVMALLSSLANDTPPPPAAKNPALPPGLSELIVKLLAKDPAGRPGSAREVSAALREMSRQYAAGRKGATSGQVPVVVAPAPAVGQESVAVAQLDPAERKRRPGRAWRWAAAALFGAVVVVAGVVVKVTGPDGKETKVEVPDGSTVKIGPKGDVEVVLPKDDGKKPADPVAADPDRRAAEWVLACSGTVWVKSDKGDREVRTPKDLPDGRFVTTRVILTECGEVTDAGLANLKGLGGLWNADLGWTGLTGAGLEHLKGLNSLAYLGLHGSPVTDAGLEHLKGCPNLKGLYLGLTGVTDTGLEHLKGLTKLTDLGLRGTKVTAGGAKALAAALPECRITSDHGVFGPKVSADADRRAAEWALGAGGTVGVRVGGFQRGVGAVADLPPGAVLLAVQLNFRGDQVTDADLGRLTGLPELWRLGLAGTGVTDAGLEHLKGLPKLALLELDRTKVTDAGLAHLKGMTGLTVLTLRGAKVTADGVKGLAAALPNCRIESDHGAFGPKESAGPGRRAAEWALGVGGQVSARVGGADRTLFPGRELPPGPLVLTRVSLPGATKVTDADLDHLRGLTELSHLDLGGTRVTDAGLSHLEGLTALTALYLGPGVTDAGLARLKDLTGLTRLGLTGPRVTDAGLDHLKGLTGLVHLSLSRTGVADAGLARLAGLTGLTHLALDGTKVTDAGLDHLKGMAGLNYLYLDGTGVTDAGLDRLKVLTGLTSLSLTETRVTDAGLDRLKGMAGLTVVVLKRTRVTADGVTGLAAALPTCRIESDHGGFGPKPSADPGRRAALWALACGGSVMVKAGGADKTVKAAADLPEAPFGLVKVTLTRCGDRVKDADLERLKGVTALTHLDLDGTGVTDAGLAHLAGLTKLSLLYLADTFVTDAGLEHLKAMTGLTALSLASTGVTDAGLAHLKGLTRLGHLSLGGTRVTDAGLERLGGLTKLNHLSLHRLHRVTDAGLERLKGLTGLTSLDLFGTGVTDAGLGHLKGMTKLAILHLEGTRVGDAGLGHLKGLTALRNLFLNGTGVTDAGLEHLKGHTELTILALGGTGVTDAGLAHLKGMTALTYLNLGDTRVTDAGVAHLKGMTKLATLSVGGALLTDAGLDHLKGLPALRQLRVVKFAIKPDLEERVRKALPDCKLVPAS